VSTRLGSRFAQTCFVGTVLLLSGCGGDDGAASTSEPSGDVSADESIATTTSAAVATTTTTAAQPAGDPPGDADAPEQTEIEIIAPEIRDALGIDTLTLLTPTSGGGTRPAFEWEPVDDAFMYSVVLRGPDGRGYWGWEGRVTSIHLGGEPLIEEGKPGPSLVEGMSWHVAAYDADFDMIALSRRRSIDP